jgi:fatty acid desaturase
MDKDLKPAWDIRCLREMLNDFFGPRPYIYWLDCVTSTLIAYFFFAAAIFSSSVLPHILLTMVSILGFYRTVLFIHELAHIPKSRFLLFRVIWNAVCGIPLLVPSFTYYSHIEHHSKRHYGTSEDGEYIPWGNRSPRHIIAFLLLLPAVPILAILRFGLLSLVGWLKPDFRTWLQRRASSLVIELRYLRPPVPSSERRIFYFQEAACFIFIWVVAMLWSMGYISPKWVLQGYFTGVGVLLLNAVRVLAAHRYQSAGSIMSFQDQILDSINYPAWKFWDELWAPVGLRFHALHHLFPALPYHSLGRAHARLMTLLPRDHPYRQTESPGLAHSLLTMWSEARRAGTSRATVARDVL